MIKKLIILIVTCLSCFKSYSQEISITDFEYILLRTSSVNHVEHGMKQYGFEFNNARDEIDDSGKISIVSSFLKKLPTTKIEKGIDEIKLWQQKEPPSKFVMLEFHTIDEKKYFRFKNEIDTNKNFKIVIDKIENNCIKVTYTDKVVFVFGFENCTDSNGQKFYKVTVLNLLLFPPIPK